MLHVTVIHSFLLMVEELLPFYSSIDEYTSLFIHCSVEGSLDCFLSFAVMSSAAVSFLTLAFSACVLECVQGSVSRPL